MSNIQKTIEGGLLGLDSGNRLICPAGFASGQEGKQISHPSPTTVTMFDDFMGDVVADQWNYVEGTDTTTADGAIVEGVNGVFRLTAGDSAGTVAADGACLNSGLNWKASSGNLATEFRVKLASIASVSCFIGFTDTKSLEAPIQSAASANTITTNATDACGFMFDTSMTTDDWWMVGVANDVDATHADTTYAPVADTYETFRIEVDTSGTATFYRNGAMLAKMTGAVTASIALAPVAIIWPRSAAAGKTMDIDYIHVSSNRI